MKKKRNTRKKGSLNRGTQALQAPGREFFPKIPPKEDWNVDTFLDVMDRLVQGLERPDKMGLSLAEQEELRSCILNAIGAMDEQDKDELHLALEVLVRSKGGDLIPGYLFAPEVELEMELDHPASMVSIQLPEDERYGDWAFFYFRENNILHLTGMEPIDEAALYLTLAYVHLYCAYKPEERNNLTITVLGVHLDQDFFEKFRENGNLINTKVPGVYQVVHLTSLPSYIVIVDQLVGDEHAILRILTDNPSAAEVEKFFAFWRENPEEQDYLKAIMKFLLSEHPEYAQTFKEELEDLLAKDWDMFLTEADDE